jgi:Acetyltransferase (GNAT) domain
MHDDIFAEQGLRRAFELALGLRARPFGSASAPTGWAFEGQRFGLRDIQVSPSGLYSAICESEAQLNELKAFVTAARRSVCTRVRININPLERRADELAQHAMARGYAIVPSQTHVLPIGESMVAMRRNYHATKRSQSMREVKVPSSIIVASDIAHLEDYFAVYEASLQRWGRQGFLYPRSLFSALLNCPSVRIWMNYIEGRLACAMVILYCRKYALYWQGVSRIEANQKQAYPMVKLMDAVIGDLVATGIPYLNLGASESLPNVRRFKEEFGARPLTYPALVYESPLWRAAIGARRFGLLLRQSFQR